MSTVSPAQYRCCACRKNGTLWDLDTPPIELSFSAKPLFYKVFFSQTGIN